jgi:hypothetical protein
MKQTDLERKARHEAALREALAKIESEDAAKVARQARNASAGVPPPARETPAGWYPHPSMADTQRYWDGQKWTEDIAPMSRVSVPDQTDSPSQVAAAIAVAVAVIGLILSQQSVSLMSGSGIVWTGAALCVGAAIIARLVQVPTWARAICVIAAIIAVVSAVYVEQELDDRRQEISDILP